MVTIDKIDFSKLKPYDGKVTKCFEQLCYQIAQKEFGHLGNFTPIDGSGGDGGVEFYLKLSNGEKWGWQCKFFGDTGRLNISSRDTAIENSLETALRNHVDLTKWFLCLKTDFTTDSLSAKGKFSRGERNWFENDLPGLVPVGRTVALVHWGETSLITFLSAPKHLGIRSFFFGQLEFDETWFKKKFTENFERVKDKYDPALHSVDKFTRSIIDFIIFDTEYIKQILELRNELFNKANEIDAALSEFRIASFMSTNEQVQRENYFLLCQGFKKHIEFVFERIDFIESCFKNYNQDALTTFSISQLRDNFYEHFNKINYSTFEEESTAYDDASKISHLLSQFGSIYNKFFRNYFHERQNELHFLADAAKGKTHISCDIAYRQISDSKPALFITGDKFTDETNLQEAFKRILDIPHEFTFDEFLQALDVYGSVVKMKIPIIFDGLNETIYNRYFSPIWKNHLNSFAISIAQQKNLTLITTCRTSYANRIWAETTTNKFHFLHGFEDYETILEAVNKYFSKYRLRADLFFAPLEKFRDPIFLKIYCEIKNPNWKSAVEIDVNIEEDSAYNVFTEYLNQINARITATNPLLKANEPFIVPKLGILAMFLWSNNTRDIPIQDFYNLVDGSSNYEKDKSKADILINEGLIVTRDMRNKAEYVSFTYDVLAGFIIADILIKGNKSLKFFISSSFIQKIIPERNRQSPLFEDVISALCLLLPQMKNASFHDILSSDNLLKFTNTKVFKFLPKFVQEKFADRISFSKNIFHKSVTTLFKLHGQFVKEQDVQLVKGLFLTSDKNKRLFFDLSLRTLSDIKHPLNAVFVSDLLASMKMNERDVSWTEYIRKNADDFEKFIAEFETQCRNSKPESNIISQKQYLISKTIVWFLTSTNRNVRDYATRALYYYGRKFPNHFLSLVDESLKYNDPYIWERTLAALYGVAMAEHNMITSDNFRKNVLPVMGKQIYELIFKRGARHSTTHILARDYARRIVEICLLHFPDMFTDEELVNIRPPYSFGGIRDLGEFDYGDRDYDYSGPIHMDFTNYTIGRIVKDGHSYSNPPEKIKVRKQIYWRIFNLGWDADFFKTAEASLGNDNYYNGGRTERAKIERYGKKYSWIAYFENAGLRHDMNLIDNEWERFRLSDADIDPSFPERPTNELFVTENLLGDENEKLVDWYEKGGMPFIENYLLVNNLKGNEQDWVCVDSFIVQENKLSERYRFTFIRGFVVKESDYAEILELLTKQNMGGRWLPEKNENHYSYAGELYYCYESTYDNMTTLDFEVGKQKVTIKKGEPGYYQAMLWDDEGMRSKGEFPDEIEREFPISKQFEVLMPVTEYDWESYHSSANKAGHTTIISKEIVSYLKLIDRPQTFNLFDIDGSLASLNLRYHNDYNNNHNFVYLRKDVLERYLKENRSKFIWIIWGERDLRFKTEERRQQFFTENPFKERQVFQKVVGL